METRVRRSEIRPVGPNVVDHNHVRPRGSIAPRLLLVEAHALLATGLQLALSERQWIVETNSGQIADDVITHAANFQPRCVLLDSHLRNGFGSGVELIAPLAATGAPVIMLTAERRRTALAECLEAGATGWISVNTPVDEVDATLARVLSGEPIIAKTTRLEFVEHLRSERARVLRAQATFEQLTQREALVLAALADGLSADEIARDHFVALSTVRTQIRSLLQKLGVRSQLAAVALADAHRELLPFESASSRDRRRIPRPDRRCDPIPPILSA